MLSVMGLNHTQPRQVPSTPPLSSAFADHFLNLIPTEAESMVVQHDAMQMITRTVTPREIHVALAIELRLIYYVVLLRQIYAFLSHLCYICTDHRQMI